MKSVLLLNDTGNELHVGSSAISAFWRQFAEQRGCHVQAVPFDRGRYRVPEGRFDVAMINAEGTLSRDTDRARALIAAIRGAPCPKALLNADVAASLRPDLADQSFAMSYHRTCAAPTGARQPETEVHLPDLFYFLCRREAEALSPRPPSNDAEIVVGDSHDPGDHRRLHDLAAALPTKLRHQSMIVETLSDLGHRLPWHNRLALRVPWLSRNQLAVWRKRNSHRSFQAWLSVLKHAAALLTGRFHQAVAAIAVGTPVFFIESRTTKIARLADWFPDHPIQDASALSHRDLPRLMPDKASFPEPRDWDYAPLFSRLDQLLKG